VWAGVNEDWRGENKIVRNVGESYQRFLRLPRDGVLFARGWNGGCLVYTLLNLTITFKTWDSKI